MDELFRVILKNGSISFALVSDAVELAKIKTGKPATLVAQIAYWQCNPSAFQLVA